jgi:hypothetical protein
LPSRRPTIFSVLPTAPSAEFASNTALAVALARRLASATPGGINAGALAAPSALPIRSIVAAGTSACFATAATSTFARTPLAVPPFAPSATFANASASSPSLPGFAATHSSAFEAVIERRGPT